MMPGTSGTANTGGGGGASGNSFQPIALVNNQVGGNGGSGIVVIRMLSSFQAASTTGNPETYIKGNYRFYRFLATGSITF
jgi:hypothetical protein